MEPKLIVDAKATLGEGPLWDVETQTLLWVDIERGLVHVHDPAGEADRVVEIGYRVGAIAVTTDDQWMLATEHGFEQWDPVNPENGRVSRVWLDYIEPGLPDNRFNDGKCDPRGRFVAGTMSMKKTRGAGALHSLERDTKTGEYTVQTLVRDVTTSNGTTWSPTGETMYYIDTPTLRVDAFDYDLDTGQVANRRTIIEFAEGVGRPDGMTIDAEGMLWICHWEGARVTRWNPTTGELLQTIPMPVRRVTSCAFGGPDLDRLYITTASVGLSEEELAEQPLAGGLFMIEPGVKGLPMNRFGL